MKKIIVFTCLFFIIVWGAYYWQFGRHSGFSFSNDTAVWAQFGDYLGGVISPILTFISVVLLIRSVDLQRKANESLLHETRRQEKLEELKFFEVSFYNLIDSQNRLYEKFFIIDFVNDRGKIYSNEAVTFLEDYIVTLNNSGEEGMEVSKKIEILDPEDNIFAVTRRFYLIVKSINERAPSDKKEIYYEVLINSTDYKLICLMVIATVYFDWGVIEDIVTVKF